MRSTNQIFISSSGIGRDFVIRISACLFSLNVHLVEEGFLIDKKFKERGSNYNFFISSAYNFFYNGFHSYF